MLHIYEYITPTFDGSSSETDEQVKWIAATEAAHADAYAKARGWTSCGDTGMDIDMPKDVSDVRDMGVDAIVFAP